MSYGKYKHARVPTVKTPPPPLTPEQQRRAAAMRDAWRESFDGDDSFVRHLVEAGLIDGWRNVVSVTQIKEETNGED